jgi:hypothetical protein
MNLRKTDSETYYLDFPIVNSKIDLYKLMGRELYPLLQKMNKDMIEEIEQNESENTQTFFFSSLGPDFGMTKKYMRLRTQIYEQFDRAAQKLEVNYLSSSIGEKTRVRTFDPLTCNVLDIKVVFVDNDTTKAHLYVKFNLDIHEDLPIYMKNVVGLMMTKLFYHLKSFIENM